MRLRSAIAFQTFYPAYIDTIHSITVATICSPAEAFRHPTAENMAIHIGEKMQQALANNPNPVEVAEVKVWETDIQSATCRPVK
jgi:hypothetical protein